MAGALSTAIDPHCDADDAEAAYVELTTSEFKMCERRADELPFEWFVRLESSEPEGDDPFLSWTYVETIAHDLSWLPRFSLRHMAPSRFYVDCMTRSAWCSNEAGYDQQVTHGPFATASEAFDIISKWLNDTLEGWGLKHIGAYRPDDSQNDIAGLA